MDVKNTNREFVFLIDFFFPIMEKTTFFELEHWEMRYCEWTSKAETKLARPGDRGKTLHGVGIWPRTLAATNGGLSPGSPTMLGDQNFTFSLEFCQLLTQELVWP